MGAGLLLIAGALTRLVALAMAANMTAAIALSGIGEGEVVPSLTLAPVLLVSMAYLVWAGAGDRSIDARITGTRHPPRR